jgi:hypothetical protein
MTRFRFEGLEYEPLSALVSGGLYDALKDTQEKVEMASYVVPAALQTQAYAEGTLGWYNRDHQLALDRARVRMGREALLADMEVPIAKRVKQTVYMGAAALRHLYHAGEPETMREQVDHIRQLIEDDIESGPGSTLKIGIIPTTGEGGIKVLPEDIPPGVSLTSPDDIMTVRTDGGLYVMGRDGDEVDRSDTPGRRGVEARLRQNALDAMASMAVFGEQALDLLPFNE